MTYHSTIHNVQLILVRVYFIDQNLFNENEFFSGKFIARSIADKCIDNTDGKYFAQYKGHVKCPKMQEALDKAETLISMGDFYFLNNIWNAKSSKRILTSKEFIYFFLEQVVFDRYEN